MNNKKGLRCRGGTASATPHDGGDRLAGKRAAVREGLAQLEAGERIPFEDIEAWIDSWDTPDELPPPTARA